MTGLGGRRGSTSDALIRAGQVELLDVEPQARELRNLEARHLPGGRTQIGHPSGAHDDRAAALATVCALAQRYLTADRDPEDDRPDPDRDASRPGTSREDEQARAWDAWKARARQAGLSETRLAELDALPVPYAIGTIRDELERDSVQERLRRAGLRGRWVD